ncbi:hypothetical protein [Methylopila sp. M107]|uniref:hypothetical protein n=1 Tax=Methylopila sp. M107 TaxID=1101190 RepID=UPI00036BA4CD|nr:hypothetical protein [Methylopila sp. M107]
MSAPDLLDVAPKAAAVRPTKPLQPEEIIRLQIDPTRAKGGIAELAAWRILAALSEGGWRLVPKADEGERVSYRARPAAGASQ